MKAVMKDGVQEETKSLASGNDGFEGFRETKTFQKGTHERKFDEFASAVPSSKT